jgi:hypothetical protein
LVNSDCVVDFSQFFFFKKKRLAVRRIRDLTTHMPQFGHDRTCHVFVTEEGGKV